MNLPLPVVFMLFAFLMPGFFALFFYSRNYQGSVPDDLNWGYGIVLVVLFSGIVHFFLLMIADRIRPIDAVSILYLAGGKVDTEYAQRIESSIVGNLGWIGLYCLISWIGGSLLGCVAGAAASRFVPPRSADMILVGESGVWTVVDVLVEPNLLYRGIYHSHHFPTDKVEGYLSLFLVSRWHRATRQVAHWRRGRWQRTRPSTDEERFKAVRRTIDADELLALIRDDLARSRGLEKANEFMDRELAGVNSKAELDEWVDDYLAKAKRDVPQFSVPWPRIKNLNLRQVETAPEDPPSADPDEAAEG